MVRLTNVSKAATANVIKKAKEGVNLGNIRGMGGAEFKAPGQVVACLRAKHTKA